MATDWEKAKRTAREVLERYHITEPPVNIFDIAENEGIRIVFFRPNEQTEGVSGVLEKEKKRIYLNATESPQRQAYTLAHELAHYFLNHKPDEYGVYKREATYDEKPPKEQEVDMFAAELLMPAKFIANVQRRYNLDDSNAALLAKLFVVSESAMRFRLRSLKGEYAREQKS